MKNIVISLIVIFIAQVSSALELKRQDTLIVVSVDVKNVSAKSVTLTIRGILGMVNDFREDQALNEVISEFDSNVFTSENSIDCKERDIVLSSTSIQTPGSIEIQTAQNIDFDYTIDITRQNTNVDTYIILRFLADTLDNSKQITIFRSSSGDVKVTKLESIERKECGDYK
jgi:hypothetical protein